MYLDATPTQKRQVCIFMDVNTDMKITLRGGSTCCVPECYSNTKRDKDVSLWR